MIKIFIILFALIAIVYSFNWLASYSGEVLFLLGEYEVTISPLFFVISSLAIIFFSILFWSLLASLYNLPKKIHSMKEARNNEKVQNAIISGLVNASAGNVNAAEIEIKKIDKIKKNTSDVMVLFCLLYTSPSPRDRG